MHRASWSLVSFDVDGTIFRRPALREAAHALGLREEWDEIDDLFDRARITLRERLQSHYGLLNGMRIPDILTEVAKVDVMKHVRETVDALRADGVKVVLLTDLPNFLCADLVDRFGFDGYVASKVGIRDGIVGGEIEPLPDKRAGLEEYCSRMSIPRSRCAHVGDGRNDVPVFRAVRYSIALNSRLPEVNKAASHAMITDDLLEVYRHLRTAI
jgi:HAD superfamily phosphoserine phosphatase-like hydrolase